MRINLMIEGQESVTWEQWVALARAAQTAGLEGLFRSDHYGSVEGRTERSSLDAWVTLGALAVVTERLRLGTLVSPATFRHPSVLAKNAVTVDHVSGGRVELGMGAGWLEAEHRRYGFAFHDLGTRYDVLEEQLRIVSQQLTGEPFEHDGQHYRLTAASALPTPVQDPLPIILGGKAGPRGARLAARYADEYNTVFASPEAVQAHRGSIEDACAELGRESLPLSLMTGCLLGTDEVEVRDRAAQLKEASGATGDLEAWLDGLRDEWLIGTPEQVAERLGTYRDAGVQRFMLQHRLHEDVDMVALMGELVG